MTDEAERFNEEARKCEDDEHAEALYRLAADEAPDWSVPLYNLGWLTKYQGRWQESLDFNRRAAALAPEDQAAWWNMGIAATALGDWQAAREAWAGFGIEISAGTGPIQMNLGPTPIRLCPDDAAEVVWCDRIDPARARIRSVPLPDSGRCYDDLLLHDGAPNGQRLLGDRVVSVFDELELLAPSAYSTFELRVRASDSDPLRKWVQGLARHDLVTEDWTTIELLCKQCSEGLPHEHHEQVAVPWKAQRLLGVAALTEEAVARVLREVEPPAGIRVDSFELVLGRP